jgi:hypothetical protein
LRRDTPPPRVDGPRCLSLRLNPFSMVIFSIYTHKTRSAIRF